MKKQICFLTASILLLLISSSAYADKFNISVIPSSTTHIKAYNKDSGKYLWECMSGTETYEVDGKTYIKLVEKGSGSWGNDNERMTWVASSVYSLDKGDLEMQDMSLIFRDLKGNVVESLTTENNDKTGKVQTISSKNGKKEFDHKDGMIDKYAFGLCFMNYDYSRKNDFYFPMITNEPAYYGMTLVNKGTDVQTVEGAAILCYKVQMIPDLGMLGFVGAFIPKTYFWYRVEAPHEFVRYEGLESGLNTPYIVMLGVK
jgi:hypothetical protein